MTDILNEEPRKKLMYDDNKHRRSENYFVVLQLLRVFRDTVIGIPQELQELSNKWKPQPEEYVQTKDTANAELVIEENWNILLSHANKLTDELQGRIERATQEVTSLRDGVSMLRLGPIHSEAGY
jgi:hypothetical protein